MEIRDVLNGSIAFDPFELPILDSRFFQRLRQIKQTGFAEVAFPSATHTRYIHSLGALATASLAFDSIFRNESRDEEAVGLVRNSPQIYQRFRVILRFATLLHDIGHGPLSHTTEFAMPSVKLLSVPLLKGNDRRKATHEDYTLKIILDSELTPVLEEAGRPFGIEPQHIAGVIDESLEIDEEWFEVKTPQGATVNYRPILHQLVSSEMDADRMDYLRRDSQMLGVSYGHFDFDWLVAHLTAHHEDGNCYLALRHRALYTFEDFLIARYHMFLMVYFHHKSIVFDEMLAQFFESAQCDYELPSDIHEYLQFNDAHLFAHLSRSSSPWAKRIVERRPYRLLVELHSGIPASMEAKKDEEKLLEKIEGDLKKKKIHYLKAESHGELSKYFQKPGHPIFVRYDNKFELPRYIPIEQCTDLFQKYQKVRSITRLYVSPEDYDSCRPQPQLL